MRLLPLLLALSLSTTLLILQPANADSGSITCTDGMAGDYACNNVNLLAHLSLETLGGGGDSGVLANDIWGWTSASGKEYALVGMRDGTRFVDVTNPTNPVYIGNLPSHEAGLSDYRDIKVYKDHAFIVGDVPYTAHGMQVFDLTLLESPTRGDTPVTFSATAHYDDIGYGHNMWINEATGFAYLFRGDQCESATQMVDIRDPLNPVLAGTGDGCLVVDGADSDAECIIYSGPDSDHTGKELCFIGSDSTVGIADVTDKDNPITIANYAYPNIRRAHQGVLTADQRYWLISDTMDEMMGVEATTNTVILDVTDLDAPQYVRREYHSTLASDHNIYLKGNLTYMTNWRAGFRVSDMSNFGDWTEVAYFDTHPESDNPGAKSGAWSHYESFASGTILVNDVERGLFLLELAIEPSAVAMDSISAETNTLILPLLFVLSLLTVGGLSLRNLHPTRISHLS